MMEPGNGRKKNVYMCVTGSPCCTVEKKNCIGEITIKKFFKEFYILSGKTDIYRDATI